MKTITKDYKINAPIEKVWEAFFDPALVEDWSGSPAII